ncbi:hypothetical protein F8M41_022422 [Gigaspora margarita]|uniref:Uncharacterized protein n=1 Tax=Gigaspora margarita TaxID=4874 RepID=A0A8H4EI07_GIGMA|nr:hypothetical protein F8M41_022422 [Gigaspora margarita]
MQKYIPEEEKETIQELLKFMVLKKNKTKALTYYQQFAEIGTNNRINPCYRKRNQVENDEEKKFEIEVDEYKDIEIEKKPPWIIKS